MITLYTFGPAWGLPDPSPFVTKAMVLLKMSGLPFETDSGGFRKAPRGKLPYIRDGEEVVADSTLIRLHLERRHNIDFDQGLTRRAARHRLGGREDVRGSPLLADRAGALGRRR